MCADYVRSQVLQAITTVWPGRPYPLGASWDGEGVNFALFSENATAVELCLFDPRGRREIKRVTLPEQTDRVWHGYLPEARPGLLYGYRVHGPYEPAKGHRFNSKKLLLDPYAKSIVGQLRWSDAQFGYKVGHKQEDLSFNQRDSAPGMPKCEVIDPAFTWGDDRPPNTPWHETVIYEMHVKGFTQLHPDIPQQLRGTYAALSTAPAIDYLQHLGVTAVELMPIHTFINDHYLVSKGLRNYWGYNSIGFFASDRRYSATDDIQEFKTMVKTLHTAGIEVILDVVYNHTAEGNQMGPTLCFRGIDNAAYYRLSPDNPRFYMDYTGCGNTLDMMHPRVLQLIMDSLRYWVLEMHVDGFRFDLASALARELHAVDQLGAFMDIIHQDPVLSQVKLIAEPWDLGEGGYQVGNFPVGWTEWNGKYRDVVRDYWRGEGGVIGELAYRLTGSSDLYEHSGRRPYASVNFVTAHDGFPLNDLVSYNEKHNEANNEDNRDGEAHNRSWNCGVEGPTDDPAILELRVRQQRNFLATLFMSQGVPMLLMGDEIGRSQGGNNNAYCQDNEISWMNWADAHNNRQLLAFVRRLIRLRQEHPVLRRRRFFQGRRIKGSDIKDIIWLTPEGREMSDQEWSQSFARSLGVYLSGEALVERDERGRPLKDDDFLLLINAHHEAIDFTLPAYRPEDRWRLLLDTALDQGLSTDPTLPFTDRYPVQGRSLVLLTLPLQERNGRSVEPEAAGAVVMPEAGETAMGEAEEETADVREPEIEAADVREPEIEAADVREPDVQESQAGAIRRHSMPFGAEVLEQGGVRFRLWAPEAKQVELWLVSGAEELTLAMEAQDGGWYELVCDQAQAGSRYGYRIDGGQRVPDPASRYNPEDVHGPSQVIDPGAFAWSDGDWAGRPWEEAVVYELHVGAFTPQGTFAGIKERLDHLVELGVTAIELMPVADFPGARGWGYDGVLPYAPESRYGYPDELKELVQAAHAKGLMVLLDVVYNHFGPEGNYLHTYAKRFFTERHHTPWGAAINVDGEDSRPVREFFIHNALYWLEEFHLDGLRLDAVHAILDDSDQHLLAELAERVRQGPGQDRPVHLILENEENQVQWLERDSEGQPRHYTAQWNDDLHHAVHVLLTGETDAYYGDYADKPLEFLGRCLAEGFGFQGEPMDHRDGKPRGQSSAGLPPLAFVNFIQNHDQVGNRAFGDRLSAGVEERPLQAAIATYLLAPMPPMLFMGEEFASARPFQYFCDFGGELAAAVTAGRRKEFARFSQFADPEVQKTIPDPNDPATFEASKLDWAELNQDRHAAVLTLYRELLALRRREIVPRLGDMGSDSGRFELLEGGGVTVTWTLGDGSRLIYLANMSAEPLAKVTAPEGRLLYQNEPGLWERAGEEGLPPWSVVYVLAD